MDDVSAPLSAGIPTGYQVVEQLTDAHIEDLWRLYQDEWWSVGRELAKIRVMLQNSDLTLALCDCNSKQLVAFGRVLTDHVFKALIFDVIVEPSRRGKGLGRTLVYSILYHPSLREVRHFELYCLPEMAPFYHQWEFTEELGGVCLMRRTNLE